MPGGPQQHSAREDALRPAPTDPAAAATTALHDLLGRFQSAWRTSLRALDDVDDERSALLGRTDLPPEAPAVLDHVGDVLAQRLIVDADRPVGRVGLAVVAHAAFPYRRAPRVHGYDILAQ